MTTAMRRILILRPDHIGDVIMFSGALRVFRKAWPSARIDLMVLPHVAPWVELCPHVDRVLSTDRIQPWQSRRRRGARGSWLLQRLCATTGMVEGLTLPRYDLVMYPVSAPREDYLTSVRHMRARQKWGYGGMQLGYQKLDNPANRPEGVFTRHWDNTAENEWLHETRRTELFLAAMELGTHVLQGEVWLSDADVSWAAAAIPAPGVFGAFIGASRPERQWPVEKWARLIKEQLVAPVTVLMGGPSDREYAGRIMDQLNEASGVVNLVGETSVRQVAACIARCRAVASHDSAGAHMAVAQNVPTVCLLGGYHYGRFYPWGDPAIHRVANVQMACYHCNNNCVYGDFRCVSDITVESVEHELSEALRAA